MRQLVLPGKFTPECESRGVNQAVCHELYVRTARVTLLGTLYVMCYGQAGCQNAGTVERLMFVRLGYCISDL